jgi:hypothetical protein
VTTLLEDGSTIVHTISNHFFLLGNVETQVKICQELKPFRDLEQELDQNANVIENEGVEDIRTILEPFPQLVRLNILKIYYFMQVTEEIPIS